MAAASQVLFGIVGTIVLGLLVQFLVSRIKRMVPATPPTEALTDKWKALTQDPLTPKPGEWLGHLERLLFFGALWLRSYEIIAGWLAFKVASKWEVWNSIVAVPDKLEGVDDLDYLIARHRWGSQRLMTFLVGTLSNVLVAFAGVLIGRFEL